MATEIRVPSLGKSVVEATVGQWFKQAGDQVAADEPLVELETDKVTVEVPAPASGVLAEITVKPGDTVAVGAVLGAISEGDGKVKPAKAKLQPASSDLAMAEATAVTDEPSLRAPEAPPTEAKELEREPMRREEVSGDEMPPSPAARKLLAEAGLGANDVKGSGRRGQVLKQDVPAKAVQALLARERKPKPPAPPRAPVTPDDASREERVRMTRLRQTIAKRLKEAQDTAAMLTTFNDVDMSAVMQLRKDYREAFEKKHGVKLGFMGFFVKACGAGAEGHPRRQRRDRRRGYRLQELLSHRRRRRHRARARGAGAARRRPHEPRRDRGGNSRFRRPRARRQACA